MSDELTELRAEVERLRARVAGLEKPPLAANILRCIVEAWRAEYVRAHQRLVDECQRRGMVTYLGFSPDRPELVALQEVANYALERLQDARGRLQQPIKRGDA